MTRWRRLSRERAIRLGGEGTPLVAEFAPSVLAARLQLSAYADSRIVADVLDLERRLPRLWAPVRALEVREGHARFVARKTRSLSAEEAAAVDSRVAPYADGRLSWSRFESLVEASIVSADPDTAAAREEAAARSTFAYLAEALLAVGDSSSLDERRVKAMLILAHPAQAVRILEAHRAGEPSWPCTELVWSVPSSMVTVRRPPILQA